jgi:periplasmic iron binding protein
MFHRASSFVAVAALAFSLSAVAVEYPIGTPQQRNGMEIVAVYLQPIVMEPDGMMRKAEESDIHLEADVHGMANNPNGFEEGAWIPYLVVDFELSKGDQKTSGMLMPMVANDGPHYGANVKLFGPGKYHLKYTISPPSANKHSEFGRHTDRLTGVRPWFKPVEVEFDFTFVGIGKRGGY